MSYNNIYFCDMVYPLKRNVPRVKECFSFNPPFACPFLWNKQSDRDLALIIIMRDLVPLGKTEPVTGKKKERWS